MISMISAFTISLVLLPVAYGCAPIGGDLSKTALLQMTISPPPNYTYSNSPIDGQAFTEASAERNAKRDFRAAVMSTMAEGGLFEGMVTFSADYTAPKLAIAEGTRCTEPGTYVVSQGTIVYECVEVTTTTKSTTTTTTSTSEPSTTTTTGTSTSESSTTTGTSTSESSTTTGTSTSESPTTTVTSTTEPSTTTGTSTTEPSTTTGTSTSESSTTTGTSTSESPTTTVTSTTEPSTTTGTSTTEPSTTTGTSTTTDPIQNLLRAKRAAGDVDQVQSIPYHIVASITVETMVPIAESQWKTYAEKIQSRLEQRHIVFVDDIEVQML
ncbi:hypothetical protein Q1695_015342 [Nippostrongylus brasiliensis]|nr:hypothetical protein Q1695_015342 [Nippostrongylus brasiliensis]